MPLSFATLTDRSRVWSLDEFVIEVNQALPEVTPHGQSSERLEVNARLVRHYTSEGVLPKPLKEGGQARYDSDHLVRVLALRRLSADGFPSGVLGAFLARHDREALARFLLGELNLNLELSASTKPAATHPFQERLAALRASAGLPPLAPDGPPTEARSEARADAPLAHRLVSPLAAPLEAPASAPLASALSAPTPAAAEPAAKPTALALGAEGYMRFVLLEGIELHVRSDALAPDTRAGLAHLRDLILERLELIALERQRHR